MFFIEDNLLLVNGNILYYGEIFGVDEEMFFILENFVVLMWLRLVYFDFFSLVK